MGGASAWSGTSLPIEIGVFASFNMSTRGPAFANSILKDKTIDLTMTAVAASIPAMMGARLTGMSLLQSASRAAGTGYIASVDDKGMATGVGTVFTTELKPGDMVVAWDNSNETASFTVVEVISNLKASFIQVQGWAFGVPGAKVAGSIIIVRRPIFSSPLLFNPATYMVTQDAHGSEQLAQMSALVTNVASPGSHLALDTLTGGVTFSNTMTETQLGLDTFASVTLAKAELHMGVEAARAGLTAAENFIAQISTANVAATIAAYIAPLVAALVATRDADILSLQKGYTIANGFWNTNPNDRVIELTAKYAKEIAALTSSAGLQVLSTINGQGVQLIDALLRFQNGPLRDRAMAQELRMKAVELGSHIFLAADTARQQRWSFLYGTAADSVKRDYANDAALWGAREDLMRFSAELQQAYLGTVNAGIGKGTDAMGVTKQVLGMAVTAAGAVAAFIPGSGGGAVASAGQALMSGGDRGSNGHGG